MTVSLQASVAHMVAKVLARRATPQEEIPILMRTVEDALVALAAPPRAIEVEETAPVADAAAPAAAPRMRRPRVARAAAAEPAPPVPAAPAPPRLVRRADVASAPDSETQPIARTPHQGTVRGIVKWFDQRTRRAALRLPGWGDEVIVETALLDEMGITRLYKGQEIEAVASDDGAPRVERLVIPGGVWQVHPTGGLVRNRNHARPVVVEMKREGLRRVAARVEAEQLLGPTRAR